MLIKKKRTGAMAILLAGCLCVTGCSSQINSLVSDTTVTIPDNSQKDSDSFIYSQQYLSQDICVIPKGKQSKGDSEITAGAALLINNTSNKMLYSQNIYDKIYPASITKIVTALLVFKYGKMSDTVTISYDASHITEYGAKLCGFEEGDQISLKELLSCFLVYSGNDAGVAIAEHISGSIDEFADRMNQEMDMLGASQSHFVNPHGLHDSKHYTTAYDLYLVFHELLKYDLFLDIISQKEYKVSYRNKEGEKKENTFSSTNQYLIGYSKAPDTISVVGGKTGTTTEAGACLILYSEDEEKNDYISVILKAYSSTSLYDQMNHLLEYVNGE